MSSLLYTGQPARLVPIGVKRAAKYARASFHVFNRTGRDAPEFAAMGEWAGFLV